MENLLSASANKGTMEKKITLVISDKTFQALASLSNFFNESFDKTVISVLNEVGTNSNLIVDRGREKKRSVGFDRVFNELLQAGFLSSEFFQKIPRQLDGEGLFVLQDFDFSLEEGRLAFTYAATQDSKLWITSFGLEMIRSEYVLACDSYVDLEKNGEESLEKLESSAHDCFEELDPEHYAYEVNENGLTVQYSTFSMDDLPSLRQVSTIIRDIFEGAEIKKN